MTHVYTVPDDGPHGWSLRAAWSPCPSRRRDLEGNVHLLTREEAVGTGQAKVSGFGGRAGRSDGTSPRFSIFGLHRKVFLESTRQVYLYVRSIFNKLNF